MNIKQLVIVNVVIVLAGCSSESPLSGTYSGERGSYTFTRTLSDGRTDEVTVNPDKWTYSFGKDGVCSYYSENDHEWAYSCTYEKKGNNTYEVNIWEKADVRITARPSSYTVKTNGNNMTITIEYGSGPRDWTFSKINDDFVSDDPYTFLTWIGYYDQEKKSLYDNELLLDTNLSNISCINDCVSIYDDDTVTMHISVKEKDTGTERWSVNCEHAKLIDKGDNTFIIADGETPLGVMLKMDDGRWLIRGQNADKYFMLFGDGNKTPLPREE